MPTIDIEKKIARYGWLMKDEPGRFEYVPKSKLSVDSDYQRDAIPSEVKAFVQSWSWVACGALTVVERDGAMWVVDGGNRLAAANRRADITNLPCIIFSTKSTAEDAAAFIGINSHRKPVSATSKLRADAVAGDETAIFVRKIFASLGLTITTSSAKMGEIKAVALSRRLAERDRDAFIVTLRVVKGLADADGIGISDILLDGLAYVHAHVDGGLSEQRMVDRLSQVGAKHLKARAMNAAAFYSRGGAKVWASGMLDAVNKGLRYRFEFKNEG